MSINDAATLANLAIRLGLLNASQVQEAWDELHARNAQPDEFIRLMERRGYLTPFQSNKLSRGDKDGYFLGGYRILYKIASGSFGRVYRCDDPNVGRVVAVKVLRRKWSEDQHKIDLFMREGKMGMALHHPNIVEILAVSDDYRTKQYYIVMEFVEGGNLRDLLGIRKKLSTPEVLKILEDTTSALAYAFSRGVTHRDMKLTNILISSQGPVKLVDFGLAGGHVGFEEKEKDEVTVDRTVDYAGLEKATGAPTGDPRSDLFFLGCVAYELLTGRSPLDMSRSATSRMSAKRFLDVTPMKPDEVEAPPSVFHLVETMMSLDPSQRFQTPSQQLERIREVRKEVDGRSRKDGAQRTLFLAESNERLQDLLREKLKKQGYRVLIAADPMRALDRFRQQPFDLLIVNASTTGESGCYVFQRILDEAKRQQTPCNGILLVDPEQADWQEKMAESPGTSVLVQPVNYKQLLDAIKELT
jgi:serine/threonine protein kinase